MRKLALPLLLLFAVTLAPAISGAASTPPQPAGRVAKADAALLPSSFSGWDASAPAKPLTDVAPKPASQSAPHDPSEGTRRIAEHDAKVKAQQQEEEARAPERAAKVEAYNKKVADAEQRQRDVAQKKAEKQAEAEKKAAKAKAQQDASAAKGQAPASASASSSASAGKP